MPRERPPCSKRFTYLATFTSFHAQNDRQLINFVAGREPLAVARLVAEYQRARTGCTSWKCA